MTIQRMEHVALWVEDLDTASALFVALGMEFDAGTTPVQGVDRASERPVTTATGTA
jgi:catechol 2,3-dioxygenase-like lactoylglutathione lyase family enzyme